ncbi:transglutaminase domain-containing protein [Planctomycetes bacterium K23_9]|uniref:Transglutaminase-like superfamily protein n=1 Tax=Stieleria marina TaxID=1930275 RepID=A0A517NRA3_9BACT|nr:Transglutaminase-like superfamily protein [Planctomycetes bacterium K23_9]
MNQSVFAFAFLLLLILGPAHALADPLRDRLDLAGDNRDEIARAIAEAPIQSRKGMEFLVLHMPVQDLQSLSADFLLENTRLAYLSRQTDAWARDVPLELFLNDVLPYASINERRDNWRADFRKRCLPMVKDAKNASEAAAMINQKLFKQIGVKYSTKRVKADQSPMESIECGLASCTGLSVILIDACRSVGIPARFVGTPMWSNGSGNHSWVEIWDNGWHFTGAAEPTGTELDKGWFVARAAKADRASAANAIYATSFKDTPLSFPCVWNRRIKFIPAVNVTDRYVALQKDLPKGSVDALFVVYGSDRQRICSPLRIMDGNDIVFDGKTNDDGFDTNDHLHVPLKQNHTYTILLGDGPDAKSETITPKTNQQLHSFQMTGTDAPPESQSRPTKSKKIRSTNKASADAVESLATFLTTAVDDRGEITREPFAKVALTSEDAATVRGLLAEDRLKDLRKSRAEEMKARMLTHGEFRMPFHYEVFGEKPVGGRSLYISMHGGGGAPKTVNDRQWENQKRLYQPTEGVYVAPRGPTDTWNLWHQGHIDPLFVRLIENMVALEDVSWDRVYLMGYSAGGDGVYQLAPRMSDRWAAASMMAGHPNETSPLGLRNVPFALQVGGKDSAYKRNTIAANWKTKLAELHKADPDGYQHFAKIYPDKGHWMDREDAVALAWMAKHTRNTTPKKIVWVQDDVTHSNFYWLGVDAKDAKKGTQLVAQASEQTIQLTASNAMPVDVYLDDQFIDLGKPVTVKCGDQVLYDGLVERTIATLSKTLQQRGDPRLSFSSVVNVSVPAPSAVSPPAKSPSSELQFPESLVPAQDLPRYSARRATTAPIIDGRLDDAVWKTCEKTSPFVDLISGKETMHDTRAAILWDDDYLYVGFWINEPNVDAKYLKRDAPIYYDNDVEVFIAGKDSYYEFEINAHATVYEGFFVWQDAYLRDGYDQDPQLKADAPKKQIFDGVGLKNHPRGKRLAFLGYDFPNFKSAVHINGTLNDDSDVDQGWTVELAFPWQEMKWLAKGDNRALPPKPGDKWGIDLFRFNKYKAAKPAVDSGGWALGKHGVWDSHIPEIFPIITFVEN